MGNYARARRMISRRVPLRLVFPWLALLAAGAVSLWYFGPRERQNFIDRWQAQLVAMADDRKSAIESWVVERFNDAGAIASDPTVIELAGSTAGGEQARPIGPDRLARARARLEALRGTDRRETVMVLAPDGTVLASAGDVTAGGADFLGLSRLCLSERVPHVAFGVEGVGNPVVRFAVPVVDEKTGAALATVGFAADPDRWLYPFLERRPLVSESAETVLVRRDGDDALFLSPLRFRSETPPSFRRPLALTGFDASAALAGREAFGEFVDYRAVPIFAVTRHIAGTPWGLVVKVDREEVLRPYHRGLVGAVTVLGALALAAASLTYGSWRRQEAKNQAAVRESARRLQSTLDNMLEGCQIIDSDWRYVYVNESAARHGRRRQEDLIGQSITDLYPGIENSEMFAAMRRCLAEKAATVMENLFTYPDGGEAWFDLSIQPVPEGVFVLSIDVTERKRAEEAMRLLNVELEGRVVERTTELAAANRELEAFAYSVSHDLRAPLRAIDGFSRILGEDYASRLDVEGKRVVGVIRENTRRMGELIDDLLSFSRAGRHQMQRSHVDMRALVGAAFAKAREAGGQRRVEFTVEEIPDVAGDVAMLRQVWINLLANAVKFSLPKQSPRIEVRGRIDDGEAIYQISDNGVGFDMTYAEKLFGVFQRLHNAREFPGTGVGLALVQRIVQRHGGRVWAEGRPGEGATFSFSLPLDDGRSDGSESV
jgi:PAS domain S-box-containing protein